MKRTTPPITVACMLALGMALLIGCTDAFNPPKNVTEVTIDEARPLMIGETFQFTATIAPADATNKRLSWASDNTAVASVDAEGLVTAVSRGSATISVTTEDQNKTDNVQISVHNGYVSVSFTNTADASDTYSFWLTSGPAQGSALDRDILFTEYDVPCHTLRDFGDGIGSRILASNTPMDKEYGQFIPLENNYPFESFELHVPDAVDDTCIGDALDAVRFSIHSMQDASTLAFSAGYSSLDPPPISVTFTEFGDEYVGGIISGSVSDSRSTEYEVSGEFRVLRAAYAPKY